MKQTIQTNIDTINRPGPLETPPELEIISLFDAAGEFLHSRPKAASEDPELVYAVVAVATWLDRTTFSDLRAALRLFHPVPQVRQRLALKAAIKSLGRCYGVLREPHGRRAVCPKCGSKASIPNTAVPAELAVDPEDSKGSTPNSIWNVSSVPQPALAECPSHIKN